MRIAQFTCIHVHRTLHTPYYIKATLHLETTLQLKNNKSNWLRLIRYTSWFILDIMYLY